MITYACGHTVDDPRTIRHAQVCIRCWDAERHASSIPIDVWGPYHTPQHPKSPDQWETVYVAPVDSSHAHLNPHGTAENGA